ncbi:metallophosphoesterase family protein [Belnapia sp. T18]|uniref:Metallophosphoesterase family protein n=1 Tax=Belnapia arida TaxID=2804533 RepID=A0ABS1UCW5_9PROT|nr:metallophosphoesterase family protein [Belnapia arida]
MRIAVIADVHGNLIALEAVLAHLRDDAPDLVVNLGDLVSGPFDPRGSAEAQMALACPTVAGNHEREVSTVAPVPSTLSPDPSCPPRTWTGCGICQVRCPWSAVRCSPVTEARATAIWNTSSRMSAPARPGSMRRMPLSSA